MYVLISILLTDVTKAKIRLGILSATILKNVYISITKRNETCIFGYFSFHYPKVLLNQRRSLHHDSKSTLIIFSLNTSTVSSSTVTKDRYKTHSSKSYARGKWELLGTLRGEFLMYTLTSCCCCIDITTTPPPLPPPPPPLDCCFSYLN